MVKIDRKSHPLDEQAVNNFREYLRIPSVHPDINYDPCVTFLQKQAKSLGLPIAVHYCVPGKPVVILTWIGQDPALPSILLNSHMDVVPVFEDQWTFPPFGAEMDEEGNIYARGAQDMKSVGIQYLEAIRRLKNANVTLTRTIHVSFVPEEEMGGAEGMGAFAKSQEFKNLNVGFALDEGMANEGSEYDLYYGERSVWRFIIHCPGQSGHGSLLLDDTPGEKVRRILDSFYDFRSQEKKKLDDDPSLTLGDVTTVNLTQIEGGVQANVVPPEMTVGFDCRVSLTTDPEEFEKTMNQWCKEAGEDVWIEFHRKAPHVPATKLDESNRFWVAFKKAADKLNLQLKKQIFPAATDSRYIRPLDIPALGYSPMNHTPVLLHDNDEFLNVNIFLQGIDIYYELISAVANTSV